MKVTFKTVEEEFIYYSNLAIKAKKEGNRILYLTSLSKAVELKKQIEGKTMENKKTPVLKK